MGIQKLRDMAVISAMLQRYSKNKFVQTIASVIRTVYYLAMAKRMVSKVINPDKPKVRKIKK